MDKVLEILQKRFKEVEEKERLHLEDLNLLKIRYCNMTDYCNEITKEKNQIKNAIEVLSNVK